MIDKTKDDTPLGIVDFSAEYLLLDAVHAGKASLSGYTIKGLLDMVIDQKVKPLLAKQNAPSSGSPVTKPPQAPSGPASSAKPSN